MTFGSRQRILRATAAVGVWAGAVVIGFGQAGQQPRPPMAEEVFKNVRVLKGIPVDEFMGTMGVFSAALGISCADCHEDSDTSWDKYALDTVPKKVTARRMVQMMGAINQGSFQGRQVVTCYTCHRGSDRPKVTPRLSQLYGDPPPEEPEDIIKAAPGAPSADQVFDKYIQAVGGAQRLAALTGFVAKGTSVGYGPEGTMRPVEIFAKAPGQRTTIIHTLDGDSTTVYDGRAGWIAAPHRPVPVLALSGGELDGLRLDAELSFPARIKQSLRDWRVGAPTEIEDRMVDVVQGTGAGGVLATFYFDRASGLLTRLVRYADSRVGRLPTQIDYSDYREVAGVKMPFKWKMAWLDGLENFAITDVQPSTAIDAARFAKPPAPKQ
jgi:photosynthetic reaction center cytochrome c subunit